jgi:putative hemolysin
LEILVILGLILINGVFAMAEIAIVSARKARLQQLVDVGEERASLALRLANEPADFLSTVQIGITLVGILAGAFSGATLAGEISGWIGQISVLRPYSEAIAIILVVIGITYFSLILGELAPKRFALINPEKTAMQIAPAMHGLSRAAAPIVRFLSLSTNFVLRIFRVRSTNSPLVTEEEIKVLIEQATEAGIFNVAEQDMVSGVFRLGDRRIGSMMTPRTEVVWLDLEDSEEKTTRKIVVSSHTRFPVATGNLDNVQGVVESKDLLARSLEGRPLDLLACLETALFVPENMAALQVLEKMKGVRHQMVLVIDEYGGFQGLVTLNDILEAIVGDIPIQAGLDEPGITRREDGSWLIDGLVPIDEFMESLNIKRLPFDEAGYYQTVGGFMMTFLGHIPSAGDNFELEGYRYEVVDMDGMRVDKILVSPVDPTEDLTTSKD